MSEPQKTKLSADGLSKYLSQREHLAGAGGLATLCVASVLTLLNENPTQPFDVVLATQIGNLGLNVLAGFFQQFFQDAQFSLTHLTKALERDIKRQARLRIEIGKFLNHYDAFEVAKEIANANPAVHGWFLTQIYKDLTQYQDDFDRIHHTLAEIEQQIKQLDPNIYSPPPIRATAPTPPPHFTGRREHLEALKTALRGGQTTAITALQGMGGIGKTATALQLAAEVSADFPGGVFWGALPDQAGNPTPILRAWSWACGQDLSTESDRGVLASQVRNLLTARQAEEGRLLVILDDVRQVWLEEVQLLKQAVPLKAAFLFTTRNENLAMLLGAAVHRLDTLPPDEALTLLKAHAGAAVVEAELEAAQKLLEVVGYLPLAIELAGTRLALQAGKPGYHLATFGEAVAQRATDTLILEGHPGLAATFAITYEALSEESQRLFRWLGAFAAGSLYVAHVAGVLALDEAMAEKRLDELVPLALLAWGERPGSYTLHPLLRQYAQTLLTEANETEETGRRHLVYYLAYAQANAEIDPVAHDRLEATLPNLLAAVDFAVGVKDHEVVCDLGHALCGKSHFLTIRGYNREARSLLEKSISACREIGDRRGESGFLGNLGVFCFDLGEVQKAIDYYEQALTIAKEIGNQQYEGAFLGNLGIACRKLGKVQKAIDYCEQALTISQKVGDRYGEGANLGNLGNAYSDLGEVQKAIGYYEQSLTIAKEISDRRNEGRWLGNLGEAYSDLGEIQKAIDYYKQALTIAKEIGDRYNEGIWLGNLGEAYSDLGEIQKAIGYYEQSLTIAKEIDDQFGVGENLGNLGNAYRDLGEGDKAREYLEQSLCIFEAIKSPNADLVRERLTNLGAEENNA